MENLTSTMGWDSPLARAELLADWAEIVGADTAAHTEPIGIEGGLLTVRCDSTAWATQLRRMSATITTKIATRFAAAGVESVQVPGAGHPLVETRPQSNPRAGSARYLRLSRQIRSSAPRKRPTGADSRRFWGPSLR